MVHEPRTITAASAEMGCLSFPIYSTCRIFPPCFFGFERESYLLSQAALPCAGRSRRTPQRLVFRDTIQVGLDVPIAYIDWRPGHVAGGLFILSVGFIETV